VSKKDQVGEGITSLMRIFADDDAQSICGQIITAKGKDVNKVGRNENGKVALRAKIA
jgi:hypothetical protein